MLNTEKNGPGQARLETPAGAIEFTLTRKKVRNLNLRVRRDGTVAVSAPLRMPRRDIDRFLRQKAGWIVAAREKVLLQAWAREAPCRYSPEECMAQFLEISGQIFPLFADLLGGRPPALKVREMKSRWGVCHPEKRYITLNTRLAEKPKAAVEYVILHEYVHFLHPDHGPGFHAEMARLMPDYKTRRKLLK